MPVDERKSRVERVIRELGMIILSQGSSQRPLSSTTILAFFVSTGLSKVRNTYVGSALVRGVSGGERKRVNIATELVCALWRVNWILSTGSLDSV